MEFIDANQFYSEFLTEKSNNIDLLVEIMVINNIVVIDPVLTVFRENLHKQAEEYSTIMAWDTNDVTVLYYEVSIFPEDRICKCIFILSKWNIIKAVINRTLKMKAFL